MIWESYGIQRLTRYQYMKTYFMKMDTLSGHWVSGWIVKNTTVKIDLLCRTTRDQIAMVWYNVIFSYMILCRAW